MDHREVKLVLQQRGHGLVLSLNYELCSVSEMAK